MYLQKSTERFHFFSPTNHACIGSYCLDNKSFILMYTLFIKKVQTKIFNHKYFVWIWYIFLLLCFNVLLLIAYACMRANSLCKSNVTLLLSMWFEWHFDNNFYWILTAGIVWTFPLYFCMGYKELCLY